MCEFRVLNLEEEKTLNKEELKKYYLELRKYYSSLGEKNKETLLVHKLFNKIVKGMRSYPIDVDMEKLDCGGPVIFACNHSNMHDYYTVQEVFKDMVNTLVASDGVSDVINFLFRISGGILIDRNDKDSCFEGTNESIKRLMNGNDIVIFPESTWNLHPSKLMLPIKIGVVQMAAKSGCPIVPVIFEYVENNKICSKESEIYDKCVVKFGEPIYVDAKDDYLEKLDEVRDAMATVRWDILSSLGVYKREDLSSNIYFNHTDLRCNSGTFTYDYIREIPRIYGSDNYIYKDYPINRVLPDNTKVLSKVKN